MIKSFKHAGLEGFFKAGSKAGIQPENAKKLSRQLFALNNAKEPSAMNVPGWKLHPLKGNMKGHWSILVNGNWRMTFEDEDAILIDYQDYH